VQGRTFFNRKKLTMTLTISIGHATDQGIKADNEDFVGSLIPKKPQLNFKGIVAAIADGLGDSDVGKQASHSCVVSFLNDYYSTPDSWSVKQSGQKILLATNSWLYSQGQTRYLSTKGMVSTLSILVLKSTTANIFHIGDSRIYRLRQGGLEQLTRDHRVWVSKDKSYLNRAMGMEPRLQFDYQTLPLEKGDLFLMTTDGVHDFVDEKTFKTLLQDGDDLKLQAAAIVQQARDNKSDDNLSCQLIRIEQLPDAKEDEIVRQYNDLPFPPQLAVGMMLDHYRIEAELPTSNRTQTYKAVDTLSYKTVIVKVPLAQYARDTYYIQHFLHEEWAGKRISHDNVLKVLSSPQPKTSLYYVTEFVDGRTLRQWMQDNPKPDIKKARHIIEQIAKGLQAFHRMEMLHQDLKPENIMFDFNGIIKIIDFSSVKIAGVLEITSQVDKKVHSSLNYTAPEYHSGQFSTVKSDLFSLGVISYEILNGALPFGEDLPEKSSTAKLDSLSYKPSVYCNEMVPIWMDGALRKATAMNPEYRYDTLSEFLYDLNTPNSAFLKGDQFVPLIQRNPLIFWKTLSALLLVGNLVLLGYLLR
jgi:serine/threonine protein phosphatase PrpC